MDYPRIIFKNTGEQVRNDVVYNETVFRLLHRRYTFTIFPQSEFWRFGLRLSKNNNIDYNLSSGNRHENPEFKDVHISVGNPSTPGNWEYPNRLELTQYHLGDSSRLVNRCDTYETQSPVTLNINYEKDLKLLRISLSSSTCNPYNAEIELIDYRYFKISAWADLIAFEIHCIIDEEVLGDDNLDYESETDESSSGSLINKIGGLVASDDTDWFDDAIRILKSNRFVILWWDKLPSGSNSSYQTLSLLRNTLNDQGYFEIYYTKRGNVHYRAVVREFMLESDYDASKLRNSFSGIAVENDFSDYTGQKGDSGVRHARIVFVADLLEKIIPEFSVNDFEFLPGYSPPTRNNLQPFLFLRTSQNSKIVEGEANESKLEQKRIRIEAARQYSITNDFEGTIGVKELAGEVFELIKNLQDPTGNMVGIFGQWGRGKTFFWHRILDHVLAGKVAAKKTFKEKLQKRFSKGKKEESSVLYDAVDFHAWKYQDTPASWAYLYESLSDKYLGTRFTRFFKRIKLNTIRHGYRPLLTFLIVFGSSLIITYAISLDTKISFLYSLWTSLGFMLIKFIYTYYSFKPKAIDLFNKYSEKVSYHQYLGIQAEIQKEIICLLRAWIPDNHIHRRKIIVFVDDIDRCDEERIIKVIDAFKVMLEDPSIARRLIVLMAIDERLLKMAIKKKYYDLVDKNSVKNVDHESKTQRSLDLLAREYIDKLFIVGIKLGDLSQREQRDIFRGITKGKVNIAKKNLSVNEQAEKKEEANDVSSSTVYAQVPKSEKEEKEPEIEHADENYEIEEYEFENLVNALTKYEGLTPRAERIFYYRYLLAKRIIKQRFPIGSNFYTKWHDLGSDKSILPNMIIRYASVQDVSTEISMEKIRYFHQKSVMSVELYDHTYKIDSDLYYELLRVVETVVPY